MAKKLIRSIMPNHKRIRDHRHLRMFGTLLHDPNLWHFNRRSASGAFALGVFLAFIPIPFQMVAAAALAIILRINLPLSVGLVWISNPLTMPAMYYFTYRVGAMILGIPHRSEERIGFEFSLEWFSSSVGAIWEPLYLGSLLVGAIAALLSYLTIRGLWQLHLVQHYHNRKRLRRLRELDKEKSKDTANE